MRNPIQELQQKELEKEEIGLDILKNSRNELYLSMRFLDSALSALRFVPDVGVRPAGTDGTELHFCPDALIEIYQKGRIGISRLYLHMILHCLFCHPWMRKGRKKEVWNLACDIAAEALLDSLYLRCIYRHGSSFRRETYRRLEKEQKVITAEGVYRFLEREWQQTGSLARLREEFTVDNHVLWETGNSGQESPKRQEWDERREKMQTEIETISKEASSDMRELLDQLQIANRQRYDYREFLRKFAVLKEEMKVDMDTFDYIYYNFGMNMYGNMPLIEPLETKETKRVEDFVIVIDTSMSCKGDLVKHFLEETYSILSQAESFFRRLNIHIIQCDDRIQEDQVITKPEEMKAYMENFTVKGQGGTDFRPAFLYVEELLKRHAFQKLRGLLYFTDGYGIFPVKKPSYDTAFIFMKDDYRDVDVPPWAVKIILDAEEYGQKEVTV
ncbi:MAG: VWA-like domain-containing protein [Candidatus Limivivens sp.]|nr:VWA-like domain-containing protein [Candidatus Limivivens sp.]